PGHLSRPDAPAVTPQAVPVGGCPRWRRAKGAWPGSRLATAPSSAGPLLYPALCSRPGALTSKKIPARLARAARSLAGIFLLPLLSLPPISRLPYQPSPPPRAEVPMDTPFDHTSLASLEAGPAPVVRHSLY